ncbi:MAG TPA: NEW3 domain-containing protein [Candidatus Norongarragalinales archaeon]|nr:NEW3 domain-containing protein [Candidatus Norongarragalinales archaeon]
MRRFHASKAILVLAFIILLPLPVDAVDQWYNSTWHFRQKIEVNASGFYKQDWPIELGLNFTQLLLAAGSPDLRFDNNSIRVFEYNSSGSIMHAVPHQFDTGPGYSPINNSVGELVFVMNGTTAAYQKRIYYVYFDSQQYPSKPPISFSPAYSYSWGGEEANVNNSVFRWYMDTKRGENTSGVYRAHGPSDPDSLNSILQNLTGEVISEQERTFEYSHFANSTADFSYAFANNATFIAGPVRLTMVLSGDEALWDDLSAKTGEARLTKKYRFYGANSWFKVEQTLTNAAGSSITRSSTPAGGLALDYGRTGYTETQGNQTNPYSWTRASLGGSRGIGFINYNQSGTSAFAATVDGGLERVGINLSTSSIPVGGEISQTAIMDFNDTDRALTTLLDTVAGFQDALVLAAASEPWKVNFTVSPNATIFNRNETLVIRLNITGDTYNFTSSANVTINNGTPGTSDDFNLTLYDDGSHNDASAGDGVFGANFTFPIDAAVGEWNITARVYGQDLLLLSENSSTFNITDVYIVGASVVNYFGLAERLVSSMVTVTNFRGDLAIVNANISCNYPLNSTIDYGNSTYAITFQAPSAPGNFTLLCNATKSGNTGNASAQFASESRQTYASLQNSPFSVSATNITLVQNFNFSLQINITNIGNGSANFGNVTLELPGNWTASNLTFVCGNVSVGAICISNFTITVSNRTIPGIFPVNATFYWQNPDGSSGSNTSQTNVTVNSNPILESPETYIYEIVGVGAPKVIGNFTLRSIGNDALSNITFNITGLPGFAFSFTPENLSALAAGAVASIQVNLTVPGGQNSGDYQGYLNITSANGGNHAIFLNITVSGANVSIAANPLNFTADNITQTQNQSFDLQVNLTNSGNATSFLTNITLQLPAGIAANASVIGCGNLTVGSSCSATFAVTVLNGTIPGTYLVNASANWADLGSGSRSNTTQINITVLSNPLLGLSSLAIAGNATHGNTTGVASFILISQGNDALSNLTISIAGLQNFTIAFSQTNISSFPAGSQQAIDINVTVPFAYDSGFENGTIIVETANGGSQNITLQVFVNIDRDWSLSPSACEKTESPDMGVVCEITVNNTGNTFINFSINPVSANYSTANASNFSVQKQSAFVFNITYNISGVPKITYNTTFILSALSPASLPTSQDILVSLVPFQSLAASLLIAPLVIQNNQSVTFDFNITDANLVGIKNVTASIALPNGSTDFMPLWKINTTFNASGNITQWRATYPNVTGTTSFVGNYSVTVIAIDNVDVNGSGSGTFYAYPKLQMQLQTLSSSYGRGSLASIYFRASDLGGLPLRNSNVTLWARDNSSFLVFNETHTTSISGIIEPLPTFAIPEDSVVGTWRLFAHAVYFDSNASVLIEDDINSSFLVLNDSTTNVSFSGLLTDFKTSDLFFGGDEIEFAISVYDVSGAPLDPDSMNITIFSPNETVYSDITFSQINRSSTGLYFYKTQVPRNITSGVYRAELNASLGAFFTRNLALFRISGSLFADVETSFVWYPASIMTFRMLVYTGDGQPIDPTTMNLTVIDPAGNVYFTTQLASMTKQSTGYYIYNFAMGANTSTGNYYAQLFATKDSSTTAKLKPFRVSQGGPYDVRLELLDSSVYPGDYLDFRAVAENKGEVTQDVTLEYWVSDGVQTWFYGSEAILTPAYQNTSVIRSAYIFTTQPPGTYTLFGRVTYDLIKPPIDVGYTFEVVARPESTPTPAPGAGGGAATPIPGRPGVITTPTPTPPPFTDYSGMQIVSYPDEVAIQAGETKYPKIQVKNTGLTPLHNVTVTLAGIPLSWLEVLPSRVNALAPGDIATFVLKITAPTSEKTSIRKVRALALSSERKEEVSFDVAVFESELALIEYKIRRLKERVAILAKDVQLAESAGKNVIAVWETVDQVQKYITQSENDLRSEQLDDALSNAQIAETLLSKGNAQLISAPFNPASYAQLPNWITLAMGVVGMGMGILVFWFVRKRKKQPHEAVKEAPTMIEKVSEIMEKTDARSLQKEKGKIARALRLLEEELHDGSISQDAYNELKRRYDRKIMEIEKKLSLQAPF